MQRKLIKQGAGLTFYVPKKWVNRLDLKKGDDIQIDFQGNDLVISSTKKEKSLSEIKMDLPNLPETGVRTAIINAYRAGYDRIVVTFEGDKKFITNLTNNHMIGFEMFKKSKNGYILDSVASPSYEHFENMFQKQFFIILEMIRNTGKENLLEYANKIQRYDNYLKRCISKRVLETKFNPLFWQLLGLLTQISRNIFYLNKFLTKRKLKLNKVEQNYLNDLEKMFLLLQSGYTKKDLIQPMKLHLENQETICKKGFNLENKSNSIVIYYFLSTARLIYIANSPLMGIAQLKE